MNFASSLLYLLTLFTAISIQADSISSDVHQELKARINWEQDFLEKGQQAKISKNYYDANFYLKEVAFSGKHHQLDAKNELLTLTYPKLINSSNETKNSDNATNKNYLKAKSLFVPIYNFEGTLSQHVMHIKKLSKSLDKKSGKGVLMILRLINSDHNPTLHYTFYNKSIYDIIESICSDLGLKFKIKNSLIILHEQFSYSYIQHHQKLFKEYVNKFAFQNDGSELPLMNSFSPVKLEKAPQNLFLFKNFLLPNFVEKTTLNFYQVPEGVSSDLTRAEIEKHPSKYKLSKSLIIEVRYKTQVTFKGLTFNYDVENQIQKMTVTWQDKPYNFNYLGACDQVITLDNKSVLLIKVR